MSSGNMQVTYEVYHDGKYAGKTPIREQAVQAAIWAIEYKTAERTMVFQRYIDGSTEKIYDSKWFTG
jgi:hypothetical protein